MRSGTWVRESEVAGVGGRAAVGRRDRDLPGVGVTAAGARVGEVGDAQLVRGLAGCVALDLVDHQPLDDRRVLEWEVTVQHADGPTQMLFWAKDGDFDAFDAALEADPNTEDTTIQADIGERRLYRTNFSPSVKDTSLVPTVVELGGVLQESIGTSEGWRYRVQLPNRKALERLNSFAVERGWPIEINNLYRQTSSGEAPILTDAQQEMLITAVECGYLQIPREATLEEVGEELGITQSAASERFRRGVRMLIEETVPSERSQE